MKPGDDTGEIELRYGRIGQHAVDDHVDRGRDQDAERAARGDGAEEQALGVAVLLDLADGDGADGRSGGDARAGRRREHRAGSDVGMHEPAGQPWHPQYQCVVHPLGDAASAAGSRRAGRRTGCNQQEIVRRRPGHLPDAQATRAAWSRAPRARARGSRARRRPARASASRTSRMTSEMAKASGCCPPLSRLLFDAPGSLPRPLPRPSA